MTELVERLTMLHEQLWLAAKIEGSLTPRPEQADDLLTAITVLSSTNGDDGGLESKLRERLNGLRDSQRGEFLGDRMNVDLHALCDVLDLAHEAANRIASLNAQLERMREALTFSQQRWQQLYADDKLDMGIRNYSLGSINRLATLTELKGGQA
jgi:hypothetical protein